MGEHVLKKWSYLFIAMGATLWGIISVFVIGLHQIGFSSIQIVAIRAVSTALLLTLSVGILNPSLLKIKPGDIKYFLGTGILSIAFFNWCYFTAIQMTSVSVAAILLYTAPAFVTILSRIFFKEWLTRKKLISLLGTFAGCTFVVGLFPETHLMVTFTGILIGIGAGLGYALYSIFGKFALQKYNSITVTTYTFLVASLGLLPVSGIWKVHALFILPSTWVYVGGLTVFSTVIAYLFYTLGLSQVESSRASIMATIEPLVATLTGAVYFAQALTLWQIAGIILILAAVIFVQEKPKIKLVRSTSSTTVLKRP
jgi:drug/metabolite transporter (DMT)-like permease